MQKSSKLELFYQIVKIHEFLKYARRSMASKALPLDDLSEAVSAYYQEVVWHPRCSGEFLIHTVACARPNTIQPDIHSNIRPVGYSRTEYSARQTIIIIIVKHFLLTQLELRC